MTTEIRVIESDAGAFITPLQDGEMTIVPYGSLAKSDTPNLNCIITDCGQEGATIGIRFIYGDAEYTPDFQISVGKTWTNRGNDNYPIFEIAPLG